MATVTATVLDQHNQRVIGIHAIIMQSNKLHIPATSMFAMLPISCFVSGLHIWNLPFFGEDPPDSLK